MAREGRPVGIQRVALRRRNRTRLSSVVASTEQVRARFATPSGGRFPQVRVVTLVACGTRRVLAAEMDSCGVSEQRLWDRLVGRLQPGTLNLADRNFFSMDRWRAASATGAHLVWRVKNGARSVPARVVGTLPDGSELLRLRESDGMLARRRKATGQKKAPRLEDMTARLVSFVVTVTDEHGRTTTSRFRVLTTLVDHEAYPAEQVAAVYAQRWQVELAYKTIKTTLRSGDRRLRGQSADLAEQEICCAMRRSVISPAQRGEMGGISLDPMADSAPKGNIGDGSMPGN
jgi:hypothetical protein